LLLRDVDSCRSRAATRSARLARWADAGAAATRAAATTIGTISLCMTCYCSEAGSARGVDDFHPAVARPAVFAGVGALRALFAVADHGELVARATIGLQGRGDRVAAALAQAEVVVAAAALVGVAFQGDARGRAV